MLRRRETPPILWETHTFSKLRLRQMEESKKRLRHLPPIGLSECTDADANLLWQSSWYGEESPGPALHTADELRATVLNALPAESLLLSEAENAFLTAMLAGDEQFRNHPASRNPVIVESLARRLWCTVQSDGSDHTALRIDPLFAIPLSMILSSPLRIRERAKLTEISRMIRGELDLLGCVPENEALSLVWTEILRGTPADQSRYVTRWLHTSFDYIPGQPRLLVHEAVADPYGLRDRLTIPDQALASLTQENLDRMTESAAAALETMTGTIDGAVRGETSPETLALDLQLMGCQGASLAEMEAVLRSELMTTPSRAMLNALRLLKVSSPCWGQMKTGITE